MSAKDAPDDIASFLLKSAEISGVACSTVSDGHVLVFTRQALVDLLDKAAANNDEKIVIFLKRPDFKN